MKKVRLLIIILLLLVLGDILIIVYKPNVNKKEAINNNKINEPNIVNELSIKLESFGIKSDFLNWMSNNYNDSLNKINSYLNDNKYNDSLWRKFTGYSINVLNDLYNKKDLKIIDTEDIAKIDFVGDVSLADNWHIMPEYEKRGKKIYGILSEEIVDILNDSNFLVVNSEFTVSNRGTPIKGKSFTFRAKPENLSVYHEMGVDLALLANNHSYDFGSDAFSDMLGYFKEYNIPFIGAGNNLEEASQSYDVVINGYKFAFLNCTRAEKNILTPGATESDNGVFRCYDTANMINAIKTAKNNSDFVIANVHFGKEGYHDLEEVQVKSAKEYIDAGADMVVGHHAHVLQGVEMYNKKPIIYNLGNFIFNSKTLDTAIYEVRIDSDGNMEYYMIPCIQSEEYTSLANEINALRIISDLNKWSINAHIDSNGKIIE